MLPGKKITDWSLIFRSVEMEEGLLSQRVAEQIRELIMLGKLVEGDQLPAERDLAEYLGVSRTVVRETLKQLKAEGFLRVRSGVGTFVKAPTGGALSDLINTFPGPENKKIADIHKAREILEPAIAALAAQNANEQDIAKMEQALTDMETYKDDEYRYIHFDNIFHYALAEATQNDVLKLFLYSVVDLLIEARRIAVSSPGAVERSSRYHRQIFEAVKQGDEEKAKKAMEEHMKQTIDDIWISLKMQLSRFEKIG